MNFKMKDSRSKTQIRLPHLKQMYIHSRVLNAIMHTCKNSGYQAWSHNKLVIIQMRTDAGWKRAVKLVWDGSKIILLTQHRTPSVVSLTIRKLEKLHLDYLFIYPKMQKQSLWFRIWIRSTKLTKRSKQEQDKYQV